MTNSIRDRILVLLDRRYGEDSSHYVSDTDVAEELGIPLAKAKRQLDILDHQGLTNTANTREGRHAMISAAGMLSVENLTELSKRPGATRDSEEKVIAARVTEKVFVVHGRDEPLRLSMFEFLRAIGLRPIEWAEAIALSGKPAPPIGDILEAAFNEAQAVVVIMSGDDVAKLRPELSGPDEPAHETELTPQARPNVLFEAGMAFGTHPSRTILVEVGKLRPFSDIAGRHLVRMKDSVSMRQDLAQRLSLAGCPVNLQGTDWHQAGDFSSSKVHERLAPISSGEPGAEEDVPGEHEFAPSDLELEIIKYLADIDSDHGWLKKISMVLQVKRSRVRHSLEALQGAGLVGSPHFTATDIAWGLSREGRAFAVQEGLLD